VSISNGALDVIRDGVSAGVFPGACAEAGSAEGRATAALEAAARRIERLAGA
jgi:hypothetical protein